MQLHACMSPSWRLRAALEDLGGFQCLSNGSRTARSVSRDACVRSNAESRKRRLVLGGESPLRDPVAHHSVFSPVSARGRKSTGLRAVRRGGGLAGSEEPVGLGL